jgi:UDP-glucose 4-epimerase
VRRIVLTGGTGFIGAHVINFLHAEGLDVVALKRRGSSPRIELKREPSWVVYEELDSALGGADAFIHLAAHGVNPSEAGWAECFEFNVWRSVQMWDKACDRGLDFFLICGSCSEYGLSGERYEYIPADAPLLPVGAYAASKVAATEAALALARSRRVHVEVIRPFHIYGPGEEAQRLYPSLLRAARLGEDFPMTEGRQVRDFTPVSLLCEEIYRSLKREKSGGRTVVRNVGTGKPRTLYEFCQGIWAEEGAAGRLLPGALPYREQEVMRYVPDLREVVVE